jgi:tetratricopeptide (TPR) repeat protein
MSSRVSGRPETSRLSGGVWPGFIGIAMPNERLAFSPMDPGNRGSVLPMVALVLLVTLIAAAIGTVAWQKHAQRVRWEEAASAYAKTSNASERLTLIERHRDVPQSALWLLQTASGQFQEGAYGEATKSFLLFVDYFPKHPLRPAALLGAAAGAEAQGKQEDAVRSYRAVIAEQSADPYRLVAEINLARLEIGQKQYAPAKTLLEEIHRRRPVNRFEGEVQELRDRLPP